jgi:serine/threonine protein kinase
MSLDLRRVEQLFASALSLTDPDSRMRLLDRECGADRSLRRRVEELLAAHSAAGSFLEPRSTDATGLETTPGVPDQAPRDYPPELTAFLAPAQAADELGRLGPYRVLAVLGHGGMGVVFRAEDPHLERLVALKVMLPALADKAANRDRFLREAKAAAAVKDDHVVSIHQVGEDRGVPYLALEFLEGEPLDVRLKRGPRLTLAEVVRIGRETALGLAAAHQRGLIHRDVKPGNLWLEDRGDKRPACPPPGQPTSEPLVATGGRVKILDFGLARALRDQEHLT